MSVPRMILQILVGLSIHFYRFQVIEQYLVLDPFYVVRDCVLYPAPIEGYELSISK